MRDHANSLKSGQGAPPRSAAGTTPHVSMSDE